MINMCVVDVLSCSHCC